MTTALEARMSDAAAKLEAARQRRLDVEQQIRDGKLPAVGTRTETAILRDHPEWHWLAGLEPGDAAADTGPAAEPSSSAPASGGGAGAEGGVQ